MGQVHHLVSRAQLLIHKHIISFKRILMKTNKLHILTHTLPECNKDVYHIGNNTSKNEVYILLNGTSSIEQSIQTPPHTDRR